MGRSDIPSIDRLRGPEFDLLDQLRYDDLIPFAARYFFERTSWVTRLHHVLSLLSLAAVIWAAIALDLSVVTVLQQIGLGFLVMFLAVLPFHEAVHAIAYRMIGARE
ncbi:MAG TPA: hypothetical protein VFT12_02135, partial [Thermoanaerobaculia bacterium]|nr:hypothetical protein [Thermoanaerobaculia bacterium]